MNGGALNNYLELLKNTLETGEVRKDRTGTGTISRFGAQLRFDLSKGFPLVTTKKCHLKSIIHELLWFLNGDTNVKYLQENGVKIWNEWADEKGELGPVYGSQWRSWRGTSGKKIDQFSVLMKNLKEKPESRRHIISAWNVAEIENMALPPCHTLFQFYVSHIDTTPKLSCQLYQRSADLFLGVPFNIASYSMLTMMMAKVLDYEVGHFVHSFGDLHIYSNHVEQVQEQLTRKPFALPQMVIKRKPQDIFSYKYEDFELKNYNSHPRISAPIAI